MEVRHYNYCLGDSGVGKSSLISFLTEGECRSDVISTVGLDYSTKTLRVGEERVVFQLWDTAGQERQAHRASYHGDDVIIITPLPLDSAMP